MSDFNPCPKPPPREKRPRRPLPRNTKPIARKSWLARGTKPIPQENPARQARRRKDAQKKQRAFLKSETRKIVDERAGGRCEAFHGIVIGQPTISLVRTGLISQRCPNTTRLSYHHKTYARYGGDELPEDVAKTCYGCHRQLEKQKPHKAHRKGF